VQDSAGPVFPVTTALVMALSPDTAVASRLSVPYRHCPPVDEACAVGWPPAFCVAFEAVPRGHRITVMIMAVAGALIHSADAGNIV
jgi:hypothetical protein